MTTKKKSKKKAKKSPSPKKKKCLPSFFYVIRACKPNGGSRFGFKWPDYGGVEAPDFVRNGKCGKGLHGWSSLADFGSSPPSWYEDHNVSSYSWYIVRVPCFHRRKQNYQKLDTKVKFGYGIVEGCGNIVWAVRRFASLTKGRWQP